MGQALRNVGIVSGVTMGSRVLGLARDIAITAVFGTTALASAFVTAFTLPNLFRRLFGEGALTAALVPTLQEETRKNGDAGARRLVSEVAIAALSKPGASKLWADDVDAAALMVEADLLRGKLSDLAEDYLKMTRDQWAIANEAVHTRLAEVETELELAAPTPGLAKVATAKDPRAAWKSLSTAQKRRVIDVLMTVEIRLVGRGTRGFDPDSVICTPKAKR
jgi:hypothetical protein